MPTDQPRSMPMLLYCVWPAALIVSGLVLSALWAAFLGYGLFSLMALTF